MRLISALYLAPRLFWLVALVVLGFIASYFFAGFLVVAKLLLLLLLACLALDFILLFRAGGFSAERDTPRRLSNGDQNEIRLLLENRYPFLCKATIIDETPNQFQLRDQSFRVSLPAGARRVLSYQLRPTQRGEYTFGNVNVFSESVLGLIQRRFRTLATVDVAVYPSFVQMRKYALFAISNRLTEVGVKQIRRVGHTMEFDQIRSYVRGDDYRTVNWKATARSRRLMVNQYQDERAQQVYSLIDMGRVMKMPFDGLTLLDHAINAALALANVSILKQDKAGLVTFSDKVQAVIPAGRANNQMRRIMEALYRQATDFSESSFENVLSTVRRRISQRSLLIVYTNFESRSSMLRQLPYLRGLARNHVVIVVFFENTALASLLASSPANVESIYVKTIAEKFAFEKREIVRELQRYGLHAVLTPPDKLTVNSINAYLELKARRQI